MKETRNIIINLIKINSQLRTFLDISKTVPVSTEVFDELMRDYNKIMKDAMEYLSNETKVKTSNGEKKSTTDVSSISNSTNNTKGL